MFSRTLQFHTGYIPLPFCCKNVMLILQNTTVSGQSGLFQLECQLSGSMEKISFWWDAKRQKGFEQGVSKTIFFIACPKSSTSRFLTSAKFNLLVCQRATETMFSWFKKKMNEKKSRHFLIGSCLI